MTTYQNFVLSLIIRFPSIYSGTAVALSNGDIYSISSPNYPNDYGNQQHIAWMFRIPDNCQLNIVMNDFQTDGTDDKV